ncbi:hypothetical protein A2U01_0016643, partial [Trifolium medium]|nr:hypothetical protein [Trifolium medium]
MGRVRWFSGSGSFVLIWGMSDGSQARQWVFSALSKPEGATLFLVFAWPRRV